MKQLALVAVIAVVGLIILGGTHMPLQSSAQPEMSILGQPQLKPTFIETVLKSYGSPAAGKGQALYDLGQKYQINSDVALAFFGHESLFGTQGEARVTKSLGNLRCIPNHACIDRARGGYAAFGTWEEGFEAWYRLIRGLYIDTWKLTTLPQIIHKYAPAADSNDESGYVRELGTFVSAWNEGKVRP